ncbi:helix-turn-helix domain-containing protein [Billgrantia ethanolica]|uniref:Transcriptional regulator n=1 Tax=Billgrantia ethanolica TaxID=2733486 RepID=A0ABS9A057_9GAMM|nr:transcriptional regulator [Halomonas ethanolica]MCE8002194.1 transcriptional regulator [Halomonas ethanolica]
MKTISCIEEAKAVFRAAPFLSRIHCEREYREALEMIDQLIDDFDNNTALIERLTDSIEEWENSTEEFTEFNAGVQSQDAIDLLKLLMEQHGLGVADLPEIGSKSLVSKILNRKGRDLTRRHIEALSRRFGVSPALFFQPLNPGFRKP